MLHNEATICSVLVLPLTAEPGLPPPHHPLCLTGVPTDRLNDISGAGKLTSDLASVLKWTANHGMLPRPTINWPSQAGKRPSQTEITRKPSVTAPDDPDKLNYVSKEAPTTNDSVQDYLPREITHCNRLPRLHCRRVASKRWPMAC